MKRSMVLIELIFSIALFSIITIYSMNILLELQRKTQIKSSQTFRNLLLETTRLFLIKNYTKDNIKYAHGVLYFQNNILLDDISSYNLKVLNDIITIDICINHNKICQKWKIKDAN